MCRIQISYTSVGMAFPNTLYNLYDLNCNLNDSIFSVQLSIDKSWFHAGGSYLIPTSNTCIYQVAHIQSCI